METDNKPRKSDTDEFVDRIVRACRMVVDRYPRGKPEIKRAVELAAFEILVEIDGEGDGPGYTLWSTESAQMLEETHHKFMEAWRKSQAEPMVGLPSGQMVHRGFDEVHIERVRRVADPGEKPKTMFVTTIQGVKTARTPEQLKDLMTYWVVD